MSVRSAHRLPFWPGAQPGWRTYSASSHSLHSGDCFIEPSKIVCRWATSRSVASAENEKQPYSNRSTPCSPPLFEDGISHSKRNPRTHKISNQLFGSLALLTHRTKANTGKGNPRNPRQPIEAKCSLSRRLRKRHPPPLQVANDKRCWSWQSHSVDFVTANTEHIDPVETNMCTCFPRHMGVSGTQVNR